MSLSHHAMAYTTIALVRANHERIPDTGDDSVISQYITDADAIIDAHIRGKVSLPVDSTPPLLAWISKQFATYFYLKYVVGAQVSDEYHKWIREHYWETPLAFLEKIAECKLNFDSDLATQYSAIRSTTQGKEAIFNLDHVFNQAYHDDGDDDRYGE